MIAAPPRILESDILQRLRRLFLLACFVPALACARTPPPRLGSLHGPCRSRTDWLEQFAVRRATQADSSLVRTQHGGLAVQVREAVGAIDSILPDAQIRLFRGERESPSALIASGSASAHGWFTVDAPAPATIYLDARWYGFVSRGDTLVLRAGYRDTVVIHLRYNVVCLAS